MLDRPVRFTKHARKRIEERFGGFGIKNAIRIMGNAERIETPTGNIYYKSKAYTFVVKEEKEHLTVITLYSNFNLC